MSVHRDRTIFQPCDLAVFWLIFLQTGFLSAYSISNLRASITLAGSRGAPIVSPHAAVGFDCIPHSSSFHCPSQHLVFPVSASAWPHVLHISFLVSNSPQRQTRNTSSSSFMCCSNVSTSWLQVRLTDAVTYFSSAASTSSQLLQSKLLIREGT